MLVVPSMDPAFLRVLSVTSIVKVTNTRWTGWGPGVDLILGPKLIFFTLILSAYSGITLQWQE
jgi:hypothetical protein